MIRTLAHSKTIFACGMKQYKMILCLTIFLFLNEITNTLTAHLKGQNWNVYVDPYKGNSDTTISQGRSLDGDNDVTVSRLFESPKSRANLLQERARKFSRRVKRSFTFPKEPSAPNSLLWSPSSAEQNEKSGSEFGNDQVLEFYRNSGLWGHTAEESLGNDIPNHPDSGHLQPDPYIKEMVWNEEGQYWGYPHPQKEHPGDAAYPNDEFQHQIPYHDDGSCVPPFCMPVNCEQRSVHSCRSESVTKPCENKQTGTPCWPPPACLPAGFVCAPGYFGPHCMIANPTICNTLHSLHCTYGCTQVNKTYPDMQCICSPWSSVAPHDVCVPVKIDRFECPLGCSSHGTCDPDKKICHCYPGYKGQACEQKTDCPPGLTGEICQLDIDECLSGSSSCEQICVNTFGSFRCECYDGYTPDTNNPKRCTKVQDCKNECRTGQGDCNTQNKCVCRKGYEGERCERDVDECRTGTHECEQMCANTHGSYTCECGKGYRVDAGDFRRCVADTGVCQSQCVRGQGDCDSHDRCICRPGFEGDWCERDVDECRTGTHECEQMCVNTHGSYTCECGKGYRVDAGDFRRCVADTGVCQSQCVRGQGDCDSHDRCICRPGFEGDWCERDVDECRTGTHECEQMCVNTHGSYTCECGKGYRVDAGDFRRCVADTVVCQSQCVRGQGDCDSHDRCICRPGFEGDWCERDVDECRTGTHECEQMCVNTHGSYTCECGKGYRVDAGDFRRCVADTVVCQSQCVRGQGDCDSHDRCICRPGFEGDWCERDVDECRTGTHECEQMCVNTHGSYTCECGKGYRVDAGDFRRCVADTVVCQSQCVRGQGDCDSHDRCICRPGFEGDWCERDVDECRTGTHQCEQTCVNIHGSYICRCALGYVVNPKDQRRCLAVECSPLCAAPRGTCDQDGHCACSPGFTGPDCTTDVDECSSGEHSCQHVCLNTYGSYRCECYSGYRQDPNDRDRCLPETGCDPLCATNEGACAGRFCTHGTCRSVYVDGMIQNQCECQNGYQGPQCQFDIDECSHSSLNKCDQLCYNLPGSYICACRPGFILQNDNRTCLKISDMCGNGCLNGGECKQIFRCVCPPGFEGPRCDQRSAKCLKAMQCDHYCLTDTDGSFSCACRPGYQLASDGHSCVLNNTCVDSCENGGLCIRGKCICKKGFEGDRCEIDTDECALPASAHGCTYQCQNTYGSYECICADGYRRLEDKRTCVRVPDEVHCDPPCQNGGICNKDNTCECLRGYKGADCSEDIDECAHLKPCDPDFGICRNTPGGFECFCKPGYALLLDARHCIEESRAKHATHLLYRGYTQNRVVLAPYLPLSDEGKLVYSGELARRTRQVHKQLRKRQMTKNGQKPAIIGPDNKLIRSKDSA